MPTTKSHRKSRKTNRNRKRRTNKGSTRGGSFHISRPFHSIRKGLYRISKDPNERAKYDWNKKFKAAQLNTRKNLKTFIPTYYNKWSDADNV